MNKVLTGFSGIKGRDAEEEELDITDTADHGTKTLEFGIKGFCGCVGRAVGEVVEDFAEVVVDGVGRRDHGRYF